MRSREGGATALMHGQRQKASRLGAAGRCDPPVAPDFEGASGRPPPSDTIPELTPRRAPKAWPYAPMFQRWSDPRLKTEEAGDTGWILSNKDAARAADGCREACGGGGGTPPLDMQHTHTQPETCSCRTRPEMVTEIGLDLVEDRLRRTHAVEPSPHFGEPSPSSVNRISSRPDRSTSNALRPAPIS